MLERGVHPRVRRIGSLGEADLSPLAQLFLPLVGEGEAEFDGEVLPGREAMRRAGIACPAFGPKDGIALLNANAYGVGNAALAPARCGARARGADAAGALSLEAFRANLSPLDPRVVALRPAPGQAEASQRLLRAARRQRPRRARRCAPGAGPALLPLPRAGAWGRLRSARARRAAIDADLNGAGDSPAVLRRRRRDALHRQFRHDRAGARLRGAGPGAVACRRDRGVPHRQADVACLLRPAALPHPATAARTGFATVQKTAAALEAEIRHLAPRSAPMTVPVADGVEDYAPMTPRVIEKTRDIVRPPRAAGGDRARRRRPGRRSARQAAARARHGRSLYASCAPWPRSTTTGRSGREFERLAPAIEAGDLRERWRARRELDPRELRPAGRSRSASTSSWSASRSPSRSPSPCRSASVGAAAARSISS